RGQVTLTGSVSDFAADGSATFGRLRFGSHVARGADVTFSAVGLPSAGGRFAARVRADSLTLWGREFSDGELDATYARPDGRFDLVLRRSEGEDYTARAAFQTGAGGATVQLEQLTVRSDSATWALEAPAVVDWTGGEVHVRSFVLASPDGSPRIAVDGTLPRAGPAQLSLRVSDLSLARLAALAQREEVG